LRLAFLILWLAVSAGCAGGQPGMPPAAGASVTVAASEGTRLQPARENAPVERGAALTPSRQAFLDGYQAYAAHDLPRAAERLKVAADTYLELGDYALLYLGYAQRDTGDLEGAEKSFNRLVEIYPRSVFVNRVRFESAAIALKQGRAAQAQDIVSSVLLSTSDSELEQSVRLILARALTATGEPRAAFEQLQTLREKYPRGSADPQAREEAYALLAAYPEVLDSRSLRYHMAEAERLLKEGRSADARGHIEKGIALKPSIAQRAELLWLTARAWTSDPARRQQALKAYLKLAPKGPSAPEALYDLGRLYWHDNDTVRARLYFRRLTATFPGSERAPEAMLKIGRTLEEDGKLADARAIYERLTARYPHSTSAAEARFRAPWMLYMAGQYESAARRFGAARASATDPAERDMFGYWQARALEKSGAAPARARALVARVAESIDSNYYPALAARRIAARPVVLPAATVADPIVNAPPALSGAGEFHLSRAVELKTLGLGVLEAGELRMLRGEAGNSPALRDFVLVEFQAAGHYHDALTLARTMAEQGTMNPEVAERFRYPRAYWESLAVAGKRAGIDPYLLLALMRQESLFDPAARSSSDAQGLMQLLPSTARTIAAEVSMPAARADLFDPAVNIELGTAYLKKLFDMFGGDAVKAVAAYNGGEHAVERWSARFKGDDDEWVENIEFHETREYVKKVLGGLREYRLLYAPASGV
jgi:soluble lytic murein transglycosylase